MKYSAGRLVQSYRLLHFRSTGRCLYIQMYILISHHYRSNATLF